MFAYVHSLPNCPELSSGGNAALITLIQKVHLNNGLHNNKHIYYIYASLGEQIPCFEVPAAYSSVDLGRASDVSFPETFRILV